MSLLEVKDLKVSFRTRRGIARAVDGVSFSLDAGKTLAIVGESGSGKSVTAMSILRLLDGNGFIEGGEILFCQNGEKKDLTKLSMDELYAIRGNRISMIFQEPMTALNPVLSIGKQLCEPFLIHRGKSKTEAKKEGIEMLKAVRIANPETLMKSYPHRLSGGMRQRVMIAMALACKPDILIADEPTTALDVTIQAQILRLMKELQKENGTAILFITHDLGVVNEVADEVAVFYCGQVVERVPAPVLFEKRRFSHPYTEGLLASAPTVENTEKRLDCIQGYAPSLSEFPKGCRFAPRCKYKREKCEENPPLSEVEKGHFVRCYYAEEGERRNERGDFTVGKGT